MKKIAILSFYNGLIDRGVETWAAEVEKRVEGVKIMSGLKSYNFLAWFDANIIIPTNGRLQVLLARIFTLLTFKRMIVFGHSGPGADDKWNLLCSPNVFVVFSDFQQKWANMYKLPWTKVVKISHAVDTKRFYPAKSKPKNKSVLCVAANTPDKRIDLVREAVLLLKNVEFVAVGKGNDLEVGFDKMPNIYRQANLFCFVPNKWEAFGLVFLEALASNLPVVTIDDPVRREIVGEAGIFVENPENPGKLAEAISEAMRKNWRDIPCKQAKEFSWDKISLKYTKLFNSL